MGRSVGHDEREPTRIENFEGVVQVAAFFILKLIKKIAYVLRS